MCLHIGVHIVYLFLCENVMCSSAGLTVGVRVFWCAAEAEMADALRFIDILDHYLIISFPDRY